MDDSQGLHVVAVLYGGGAREEVEGGDGGQVGGGRWVDGGGVALNVESAVPDEVDFGFVWFEFEGREDLDGGAVVYGGHFATVHGGRGGEEVDIEGAREEGRFLKLNGGVQNVRKEDYLAGVGVREGNESSSSGHLRRGGIHAPSDPTRRGNEGAEEDKVEGRIVRVEGPCYGGLLGRKCHAFLEGFSCSLGGAVR